MKKVMLFVLSLMIGLVLSLLLGLTSMLKKAFILVRKQFVLSKRRGDDCLAKLTRAKVALMAKLTGVKVALMTKLTRQAKKTVNFLKTKLQHSKEQGVSYVNNVKKAYVNTHMRLRLMISQMMFKMKNSLKGLVQKGAFYLNKMTPLFLGVATGLVLTMMFHSKPVDINAMVHTAIESKLETMVQTSSSVELPQVVETPIRISNESLEEEVSVDGVIEAD